MGPGGIATIIAASSLLVIAVALAYAVVRVGGLVDEARTSIRDLTIEVTPLLEEVTTTVELINGPLHSINKVTKTVEDFGTKISESTENFLDKNKMAMNAAGAILAVTQLKKSSDSKKAGKGKKKKAESLSPKEAKSEVESE